MLIEKFEASRSHNVISKGAPWVFGNSPSYLEGHL